MELLPKRRPVCNLRAEGQAAAAINAAVKAAGLAVSGHGTFGVQLVGTQVQGSGFGHLSIYDCEITALTVQSIDEVPHVPPER